MNMGWTKHDSTIEDNLERACISHRESLGLTNEPEGDCDDLQCAKECPFSKVSLSPTPTTKEDVIE